MLRRHKIQNVQWKESKKLKENSSLPIYTNRLVRKSCLVFFLHKKATPQSSFSQQLLIFFPSFPGRFAKNFHVLFAANCSTRPRAEKAAGVSAHLSISMEPCRLHGPEWKGGTVGLRDPRDEEAAPQHRGAGSCPTEHGTTARLGWKGSLT